MRIPSRSLRANNTQFNSRQFNDRAPNSRFDIWFSRLANLAQFGFFILTIGGFYFTVLPLYQKALLDEAIAKKEVELKEISASLEQSYQRVRNYSVKEFVFGAGISCSGLMLPSRVTSYLNGEFRKPYSQEILEISPTKCLADVKESKNSALLNLRPDDLKVFQAAIDSLAIELDQKRSRLISLINSNWSSKQADSDAQAYAEFVRLKVNTLKSLPWK